jgi:dihydroorotate dehydrogenase (fumarate)
MISSIQSLRTTLRDAEGSHSIELNTSCPNIADCPPPANNFPSLAPLLGVLAEHYWKDPTLTLGLKLPPYVWSTRTQFEEVIRGISELPENYAASSVTSLDCLPGSRQLQDVKVIGPCLVCN